MTRIETAAMQRKCPRRTALLLRAILVALISFAQPAAVVITTQAMCVSEESDPASEESGEFSESLEAIPQSRRRRVSETFARISRRQAASLIDTLTAAHQAHGQTLFGSSHGVINRLGIVLRC